MAAAARMLPDGRRLHLHHGPIDIVFEAWGAQAEVALARTQAIERFASILGELVEDLPLLRQPVGRTPRLAGPVASRMEAAARAHLPAFATPMIAVAGAVADAVLGAAVAGRRLDRAYANNGGDVALHLAPGSDLAIAIAIAARAGLPARVRVSAGTRVRGVATSGWRGRSRSLGIADAVTVLAQSAAEADAAATLIANAVDLPGHPSVERVPASALDPDSDLGDRPVTVGVGALAPRDAAAALDAGLALAERMRAEGRIAAAALFLGPHSRTTGDLTGNFMQETGVLTPALEGTDA